MEVVDEPRRRLLGFVYYLGYGKCMISERLGGASSLYFLVRNITVSLRL